METVPWKDINDNVLGQTRTRREGESEEAVVAAATTKRPATSPSSSSKDPRIVRVSRAFGGKDRHSKVCTLRGLRDRRVRLSVPTAIQLYDLQERLGLDQPSKAVDWLLDVAKEEIDELPPLPVSPETFSLFNHHQSFLNLGQRPGQDPTQESSGHEENNSERCEKDNVTFSSNNHHIGSYGAYHNMEHHHHQQHSSFQADYHQHHQVHSLVPFPSQFLVCPMTTTTTTTQSLFPSSSSAGSWTTETTDPRRMVSHFQMPLMGSSSSSSTSQNISTLYSLLHGSNSSSNRMSSVQFNRTSRGSDNPI